MKYLQPKQYTLYEKILRDIKNSKKRNDEADMEVEDEENELDDEFILSFRRIWHIRVQKQESLTNDCNCDCESKPVII